jgi:hypothetical protein
MAGLMWPVLQKLPLQRNIWQGLKKSTDIKGGLVFQGSSLFIEVSLYQN